MRLIAVTLFFLPSAHATMMVPLDLKALVGRADRVILGAVISQESHWTESHDAIYTDSVVRVERAYKGTLKPGATVVVRREGGSVDGIGMKVFGSAQLSPGEEVMLFLEQRAGAAWVVGMAQGKWRVAVENGQKVVHSNLSGIGFVQSGATALPLPRPLGDVEREIRALKIELERSRK
jgi:hypothetical protein